MSRAEGVILIIDDEEVIREITHSHFKDLGFRTFSADNGSLGWDLAKGIMPDVVVLDMRMPGLEGEDVLKRLREYNTTTKVIVLTGNRFTDEQVDKLKADYQLSAFLDKPCPMNDLEDEVFKALNLPLRPRIEIAKSLRKVKDPEQEANIHDLAKVIGKVRMPADKFFLDYSRGKYKDIPAEELNKKLISIVKAVPKLLDELMEVFEKLMKE